VAVRGPQHPEQDLSLEERSPVAVRLSGCRQQFHDGAHAGPAIGFVLQVRRSASRLAHVFLRQPEEPSFTFFVLPPHTVEALDRKHFHVLKLKHLGLRHGQTVCVHDSRAQPFNTNASLYVQFTTFML
jgi:hypothetical protein